jgi:hypothetical protein
VVSAGSVLDPYIACLDLICCRHFVHLDPIYKYKAVALGRPKTAKTIGRTKTIQLTLNPDWRAQRGDNGFKIPALADLEAMADGEHYEDLLVEVRLTIHHSPSTIHHVADSC